ncbi:MAG: hypothetical protein BGO05_07300 [Rhizobiales bacterium 63-7]|nr:hypothetical protein [Hyphomicrobiales bacterium]OJU68508.1 MAG: hypothetical protein BGO05_07300 [Rhizobiales bacterium 63-7]
MFRRFKRRFEYRNDDGQKVTIPRNWAGEVTEEVAALADAADATLRDRKKAAKADDGESKVKPLAKMTKDELIAEAGLRGITIDPSKTKDEIVSAIEAAASAAS